MEQKKSVPIRYYIGIALIVFAFLSLLIDGGNGDMYMLPLLLSLGCVLGAALCFLPPHRKGLWIGGVAVILLHFFAQQYMPGALLYLLLDPPDGVCGPGLLYVFYGFGAFVCFIYFFAMIASVAGGEKTVAPQRKLTKILVLVGWAVFAVTCCFPNLPLTIANWRPAIRFLPFVLCIVYSWGQYALIHWLFFVTIAWIWSAFRKKKEVEHDE